MTTWITDDNGNRASIEYWGSEEAAKASLATLINCKNCENCSDCSDCSYCSHRHKYEKKEEGTPAFVVPAIENIHQKLSRNRSDWSLSQKDND